MKTKAEIIEAFYKATPDGNIFTNDIKKGDFVNLKPNYLDGTNLGWYAEIIDNMKGNIRMANVHGIFEEMGSIYVWDIRTACKNDKFYGIQLTDKQLKDQQKIETILD